MWFSVCPVVIPHNPPRTLSKKIKQLIYSNIPKRQGLVKENLGRVVQDAREGTILT